MRKLTLVLSMLLVAAVSTTADAAKKKRVKAAPVASVGEATDAQRTKFFQDAFNPLGAK